MYWLDLGESFQRSVWLQSVSLQPRTLPEKLHCPKQTATSTGCATFLRSIYRQNRSESFDFASICREKEQVMVQEAELWNVLVLWLDWRCSLHRSILKNRDRKDCCAVCTVCVVSLITILTGFCLCRNAWNFTTTSQNMTQIGTLKLWYLNVFEHVLKIPKSKLQVAAVRF